MQKINTEILENIEADFQSFLDRGEYEDAEVAIDNLKELGKYEKAVELLQRLARARMRKNMILPADYGEDDERERKDFDEGAEEEVTSDLIF